MGPGALAQVLRPLSQLSHPNLLVGLQTSDDAAVYRLSDDTALIQTVDFFPPVVDDPYTYGGIAAANAMSDVYAMGGEVTLGLNIAAWPEDLPAEMLGRIFAGGAAKMAEVGAVIAGGHTVPGGVGRNRDYYDATGPQAVILPADLRRSLDDLLHDPQTSGGLLISVAAERAAALEAAFAREKAPLWPIGEVVEGSGVEVTD